MHICCTAGMALIVTLSEMQTLSSEKIQGPLCTLPPSSLTSLVDRVCPQHSLWLWGASEPWLLLSSEEGQTAWAPSGLFTHSHAETWGASVGPPPPASGILRAKAFRCPLALYPWPHVRLTEITSSQLPPPANSSLHSLQPVSAVFSHWSLPRACQAIPEQVVVGTLTHGD